MFLRTVNQNLIPVLRALLREQSVSRAADALGLTQPAVSGALSRLRKHFGDPLLVSVGREMRLTPRARQLVEPVEAACQALEGVWASAEFQPQTARRTFSILNNDYASILIAPALVDALSRRAPMISVEFLDASPQLTFGQRAHDFDFLIAPRELLEQTKARDLRRAPLFAEVFVAVVGADHALASMPDPQPRDYFHLPHVIFRPGASSAELGLFSQAFGQGRNVVASIQQFGALPLIAVLGQCVAVAPCRIAEQLGRFLPLRQIGEPLPGSKIEMYLAWSPIHDADPAHRWFRDLLRELVADDRFGGVAA